LTEERPERFNGDRQHQCLTRKTALRLRLSQALFGVAIKDCVCRKSSQ
jgi:hypothetical protein